MCAVANRAECRAGHKKCSLKKAGIHPVYLAGIERGKRNLSFKNLSCIAEAFGISLATLFTDSAHETE